MSSVAPKEAYYSIYNTEKGRFLEKFNPEGVVWGDEEVEMTFDDVQIALDKLRDWEEVENIQILAGEVARYYARDCESLAGGAKSADVARELVAKLNYLSKYSDHEGELWERIAENARPAMSYLRRNGYIAGEVDSDDINGWNDDSLIFYGRQYGINYKNLIDNSSK